MKKIFNCFVISMIVILFTGCNSKKELECHKLSNITDGVKMTQTYNITFDNDKIKTLNINLDFSLDDSMTNMSQVFYESVKKEYEEEYSKYKGVTIKTNKESDKNFNMNIIFDYSSLTEEEKNEIGFSGSESYKDNKSVLEEKEYTCK